MTVTKSSRLLFTMTKFEAKRFAMYPTEVIASVVGRLLEIILFVTFWLLVGELSGSETVNAKEVVSYYLIINGITAFFFTHLGIASIINKMIKLGELNQALVRPINPLLSPWSQRAGRNLVTIIIGAIQVFIGIYIAGNPLFANPHLLLIVLFNTIIINQAFNIIIGSVAFYLTEASGIRNTFLHIYNLCGGVWMPLFLMPVGVANTLQLTPFPAGQYHLASLLQGTYIPDLRFVLIGTIWSMILGVVSVKFWKYSLGKYEAIGI